MLISRIVLLSTHTACHFLQDPASHWRCAHWAYCVGLAGQICIRTYVVFLMLHCSIGVVGLSNRFAVYSYSMLCSTVLSMFDKIQHHAGHVHIEHMALDWQVNFASEPTWCFPCCIVWLEILVPLIVLLFTCVSVLLAIDHAIFRLCYSCSIACCPMLCCAMCLAMLCCAMLRYGTPLRCQLTQA